MLKSNWAILLCFSDMIRSSQPLMIVQGKIRYVIMSLKRHKKFPTWRSQWFGIIFLTKRNFGGNIIESVEILSFQCTKTLPVID